MQQRLRVPGADEAGCVHPRGCALLLPLFPLLPLQRWLNPKGPYRTMEDLWDEPEMD